MMKFLKMHQYISFFFKIHIVQQLQQDKYIRFVFVCLSRCLPEAEKVGILSLGILPHIRMVLMVMPPSKSILGTEQQGQILTLWLLEIKPSA